MRRSSAMDLDTALAFAAAHGRSVLVTQRRNGRPQLSNVTHHTVGEGADALIRISITAERAKYKNLQRDPWAALHVTSDDFWSYAVLEGTVELSPPAREPDDATVDELVEYYRAVRGEHPDWQEYRAAMVAEQRVVARFRAERAYGAVRG